jgi:hypothetical protein
MDEGVNRPPGLITVIILALNDNDFTRHSPELGIVPPIPMTVRRHSFATHLLEDGYGTHTIQELLGHKDVVTKMIYTHVLNRGGKGVRSPADSPVARRRGGLDDAYRRG